MGNTLCQGHGLGMGDGKMKKNPCHECENRTMDCHAECRLFKVWELRHKIELSRERKLREKQKRYFVDWKKR